ncbi:MAG: hypothetical protein ACJ713_05820 [Candidatus Sulfotelmatobacter sp.]
MPVARSTPLPDKYVEYRGAVASARSCVTNTCCLPTFAAGRDVAEGASELAVFGGSGHEVRLANERSYRAGGRAMVKDFGGRDLNYGFVEHDGDFVGEAQGFFLVVSHKDSSRPRGG